MSPWDERVAATADSFIEQLERRGWKSTTPTELRADLDVGSERLQVRVDLTSDFPFSPPRVFPVDDQPASWHRELDGAMCLYPETGRGSLPWLDVDDFEATIVRWLESTSRGWPADAPEMDLERYFEPASVQLLVVYNEQIEALTDRYVRFNVDGPALVLAGTGVKPVKSNPRKYRLFGYVVDIGEPTTPPRNWEELREAIGMKIGEELDLRIRRGALDLLLVRYRRGDTAGTIALLATAIAPVELKSLPSASTSPSVVSLRSGRDANALQHRSVLVVGAGAVGSFVCENLVRAGLGALTIRDGDIVRPGNAVRHVVPPTFAGHFKVDALQHILSRRLYCVTDIMSVARHLTSREEVPDLLVNYDLVIDATADGSASAMLADAARTFGTRIISAALQDEGRVVRVDVIPPIDGPAIEAVDLAERDEQEYFEAGCGDPVSMTPPYAALEAAAVAARVAVRILLDLQTSPAGEIRVYPR